MYSYEQRKKAVKLHIEKGLNYCQIMRQLGYPSSRNTLRKWCREFNALGNVPRAYPKQPEKYSPEQQQRAIEYYKQHGKNLRGTIRALGYPCRQLLEKWLTRAKCRRRKPTSKRNTNAMLHLTQTHKEPAIQAVLHDAIPVIKVASTLGVSRTAIYRWIEQFMQKGDYQLLKKTEEMPEDKEQLLRHYQRSAERLRQEVAEMDAKIAQQRQEMKEIERKIYLQRLEYDALRATAELIKKTRASIQVI